MNNEESVSFTDPIFLSRQILTITNLLTEYFVNTDFYENGALNKRFFLQKTPIIELTKIDGLSYRVIYAITSDGIILNENQVFLPENENKSICPGLAVIAKIIRENGIDNILAKYICIDGFITFAPDIHTLLLSKIREGTFYFKRFIDNKYSSMVWTIEHGYLEKTNNEIKTDATSLINSATYNQYFNVIQQENQDQDVLIDTFLKSNHFL